MFAFRSGGWGRATLGAGVLAALAACAGACGSNSKTEIVPLVDASLGAKDSGGQEPSAEAGEDVTVGDDVGPLGDDAVGPEPSDGASANEAGDDENVEAGDAATTTPEAGPVADAGDAGIVDSGGDAARVAEAGAPDGGSIGTIPCGTAQCTASTQVCCLGGAGGPTCGAAGSCTGSSLACRQTANCQGGDICCLSGHAGGVTAECAPSASCTGVRLCASGDCPAGDTCAGGVCVPAGGFDGGIPGFDGGFPGFDGGFRGFDGGFPVP